MDFVSWILILITTGLLGYLLWKISTYNHDFFENQGLKYKKPFPIFGSTNLLLLLGRKGIIEIISEDYRRFASEKVIGIFDFSTPLFFVKDPELVKQLAVKDFAYFQDHKTFVDAESTDIFKSVLFSMKGQQWRDMRSSLSPLFTGSKMRIMLQLVNNCAQQMVDYMKEEYVKNGPTAYDTKNIFSKYTNDVISTCAFGVECDSHRNPKNEIYLLGQKIMEFQKPSMMLQLLFLRVFPKLGRILGIKFIDDKTRQRFHDLIINTMEVRKREGIVRPDMIQLLMKLRDDGQISSTHDQENKEVEAEKKNLNSEGKRSWTDDELIAQPFLFFLAGFDTSSTVMNFMAYELAINPDVQNRLIEEIDETNEKLNGNPLTYETLKAMKYMDMVVSEVLRKWPPAVAVDRECVKTYTYEEENGLKFTVEKGNMIWIPVYALHRDPKYFQNPEKFDPERFNEENKPNINLNAYLPFGVGPRNCIGLRFGMMQIKALFFYLFLTFKIQPSETTQIQLKLKKSVFALIPEKEIRLYFEPRSTKKVN